MCNENDKFDPNGDRVPMTTKTADDTDCGVTRSPKKDGYYQYNEQHYTMWLAHEQSKQKNDGVATEAIEAMWVAWNDRKMHPNAQYYGKPLLSRWSSYIVQLPYYMAHPFNSDADFVGLFKSHYEADKLFYSKTLNAGERGRWGLGAGPTQEWCSGHSYDADKINGWKNK